MTQGFYYETDQTAFDTEAMTDSGDNQTYNSTKQILSNFTDSDGVGDRSPVVRPDGVITGGTIAAGTTANTVNVSVITCFLAGTWYDTDNGDTNSVAATTGLEITRGTAGNPYKKDSITVSSAGAIAYVEGSPGTQYSTTRGASGGAPYVPVGSFEVGQLWYSSETSAVLTSDNIKQTGSYVETAYPLPEIEFIRVSNNALGYAGVKFPTAQPESHTGDVTRSVYISGYTPTFTLLTNARNVNMPQDTTTGATETFYDGTKSSVSFGRGDGSFEFAVNDGVTDAIFGYIKKEIWYKHYPDKAKTPYLIARGYLGATNDFPADGVLVGSGTIVATDGPYRVTG
jgi:hypothetical protein